MSDTPPDVSRENFRIEASLELEGTLLPSETDLYDLGSDERRFRDLWLAFPTPEHDPVIHIGDETFTGTDVINARNVTRVAMSALQPYDIVFKTGGVNWWKNIEPLGTPTTIAGYNITDAYGITEIQDFFAGNVAIDGYNKFDWDSTRTSVYDTSGNWNTVYNNVQGDDTMIENLKINQQFIVNPTNSNHTITISGGYIHGPNTLYIDPFDNTDQATKEGVAGTVVVLGNLQVEGTTTTINSTEVAIVDKTIELAKGSTTPAQANGAGLTVAGANVNITYNQPADRWEFNKGLKVSGTSNVDGRLYVKSINDDVTGGTLVLKHANNNTTDVVSTIFFENNAGTTSYIQAETVNDNLKGQISFFTRDGTTAKRAVTIDPQQRVGIGTNNPDQILTVGQKVAGDTNQRTSLVSFNATDNAYLEIENTTTQKPAGVIFTNVATKKWTIAKEGSGHQLYIRNASDAAVATFLQSGNVGINTVTPVVKLDINGTDAIKIPKGTTTQRPAATTATHQGYIRYNTTTSQFEGFGAGNSWGSLGGVMDIDQDTYISPETAPGDDDDTLRFFTGGLERTRINDNGYMGVGIITPGARIHADESINGVNAGVLISNYNTTAGTEQQTRLLFGLARNSGSKKSTAGEIRVGKEQDWTNDDAKLDSYMTFSVYENMVSNERVRITSGGRVGIGTTIPLAKLDIRTSGNTFDDGLIVKSNSGSKRSVRMWVDGTTDTAHIGAGQGSVDLILNHAGGNVGIGTTNPIGKLSIEGSTASDYRTHIVFNNTNGAKDYAIGAGVHGTTNEGFGIINRHTNDPLLYINSADNVGIGTTSPLGKLTLSTSSENTGETYGNLADSLLIENTSDSAGAGPKLVFYNKPDEGTGTPSALIGLMRETATDASTTGDNKGNLVFWTRGEANPEQRMIIDSNGNVGIGTTSPDAKLNVVYSSGDTNTGLFQETIRVRGDWTSFGSGPAITFTNYHSQANDENPDQDDYNLAAIQACDLNGEWSGGLKFFVTPRSSTSGGQHGGTSLVHAMTINSDGNVGIGTDIPRAKLSITNSGAEGVEIQPGLDSGLNRITNFNRTTATYNKLAIDASEIDLRASGTSVVKVSGSVLTVNPDNLDYDFQVKPDSGVGLFVQGSTGNVGIGTTTPNAMLDIVNTSSTTNQSYGLSVQGGGNSADTGYSFRALDREGNTDFFVRGDGNVGIGTSSPQAILDVTADSNTSKVTKFGNDITSHYVVTGQEDHTFTFTCGSYYQAEVVITAHQTNGGTSNNLYIRGIWSNNYTSHHWEELENVGGLTTSDFIITNTHNGGNEENGKLVIQHNYSSGSFSRLTVRVTDFFGTHSFNLT